MDLMLYACHVFGTETLEDKGPSQEDFDDKIPIRKHFAALL